MTVGYRTPTVVAVMTLAAMAIRTKYTTDLDRISIENSPFRITRGGIGRIERLQSVSAGKSI